MTATSSNPFDSAGILDGIRRWVEIETPTEAPDQINKLATLVAEGYRDLPAAIERIATLDGLGVDGKGAHTHYEQIYVSSLEPRARLLYRLYQTLRGASPGAIPEAAPHPATAARIRTVPSSGVARATSCAPIRLI